MHFIISCSNCVIFHSSHAVVYRILLENGDLLIDRLRSSHLIIHDDGMRKLLSDDDLELINNPDCLSSTTRYERRSKVPLVGVKLSNLNLMLSLLKKNNLTMLRFFQVLDDCCLTHLLNSYICKTSNYCLLITFSRFTVCIVATFSCILIHQ